MPHSLQVFRVSAVLMVAVALGAPLVSGCHSASPVTVKTTGAAADVSSVARHRTYSHKTAAEVPSGYTPGATTPVVLDRVVANIDAELQKKGYVLAPGGDGDLIVRISSGVRVVLDQPTGATAAAGAPSVPETERGIVIDIFEAETNAPLFHGYAHYEANADRRDAEDANIRTAVSRILTPVPVTGTAAP